MNRYRCRYRYRYRYGYRLCVYIYTQVLITYRIWGMYIYMYVRVFRNFLASSVGLGPGFQASGSSFHLLGL